eukprot:scaffold64975_cov16-Tisochrysis_lutea.AAC.1
MHQSLPCFKEHTLPSSAAASLDETCVQLVVTFCYNVIASTQVAWHPHSEAHLVVLTSDNCLRLYHLSDLSMAEQTFHLKVHIPGAAGMMGNMGGQTSWSIGVCSMDMGKRHKPYRRRNKLGKEERRQVGESEERDKPPSLCSPGCLPDPLPKESCLMSSL